MKLRLTKLFAGMGIGLLLAVAVAVALAACQAEQPAPRSSYSYGGLRVEQFGVTATGSEGSAEGSATSDGAVRGHVYAIHLDFADITDTTDLTLTTETEPAPTIMELTDIYTDGWYYPAVEYTDNSGSGLSAYDRLPVDDYLSAVVAESTATRALTITVYWGD
jgi:hypothetical protein